MTRLQQVPAPMADEQQLCRLRAKGSIVLGTVSAGDGIGTHALVLQMALLAIKQLLPYVDIQVLPILAYEKDQDKQNISTNLARRLGIGLLHKGVVSNMERDAEEQRSTAPRNTKWLLSSGDSCKNMSLSNDIGKQMYNSNGRQTALRELTDRYRAAMADRKTASRALTDKYISAMTNRQTSSNEMTYRYRAE